MCMLSVSFVHLGYWKECSCGQRSHLQQSVQIGNLQALAQFLSNASKSLSGTLADILSPSRMIIFGTLLTTLNKPMFAASGYMYATFGTVVTLYWVTAGMTSYPNFALSWIACLCQCGPRNTSRRMRFQTQPHG